jgi:class 3 adenylate cyclase/CheY-like chemotaxis protein
MDSLQLSSGRPAIILLVDDEPGTLQLLRTILQAEGHTIYEAADGAEAIKLFHTIQPDLVLLDVLLPKVDGLGVLHEIRQHDAMTGVIMVSALTSEQLAVKSMLGGADDYISKPLTLKTVRMHIRQVLDKVELRRHNTTLQEELVAANEKLRHYMAKPLLDTLLASPTPPSLGGERQPITILFLDFCDFTSVTQRLPPDEVVRMLNEYFGLVTPAILENGGYLDKIMGDGFMALFNVPSQRTEHATLAVRSAANMRRRIREWNSRHPHPLNLRVGIHTGEAVVGTIGTPQVMNYTAIGSAVNLAKRLEESADPGQILLSAVTRSLLDLDQLENEGYQVRSVGARIFKGFASPVDAFHVVELSPLLNEDGRNVTLQFIQT